MKKTSTPQRMGSSIISKHLEKNQFKSSFLSVQFHFKSLSGLILVLLFLGQKNTILGQSSCLQSGDFVVYDEAVSGDITGIAGSPLSINLPSPVSQAIPYVVAGAAPNNDRDAITFSVPPGTILTGLRVTFTDCAAIDRVVLWSGPNNTGTQLFSTGGGGYFSGTNIADTPLSEGSYTLLVNQAADVGPSPSCSVGCYRIEFEFSCTPELTCPANTGVCDNDDVIDLSELAPAVSILGGNFSGPFVSGTQFDPNGAGEGIYTISYTATNGNGCTSTCTFNITVSAPPALDCPDDFTVCINDDSLELTGATPTGGQYSGPSVSSNEFNPSSAGVGLHTIMYTFSDSNGCTNSCTFNITVSATPNNAFRAAGTNVTNPYVGTLDFDNDHATCAGSVLNYGVQQQPLGVHTYQWTVSGGGTIVQGANNRNVKVEWTSAGNYTLSVLITNTSTGCTASNSIEVTVNAPVAICPSDFEVCDGEGLQDLIGSPSGSGGFWSGISVTDNGNGSGQFDPTGQGGNVVVATYTFTDSNGCSNSCTTNITVNARPGTPVADVLSDEGCEGDTGADRARVRVTLPGTPANFEAIWIIGNNPAGLTPGTEYGPGDNVTNVLTFNTANRRTARIEPGAPVGDYEFCVRIRNRNTGCESIEACGYTITVNANPIANNDQLESCETSAGSGEGVFDLTSIVVSITGEAFGVSVTWYSDSGLNNEILDPSAYVASSSIVYAEITNSTTGCSSVAEVDLIVNSLPILTCPSDFGVCTDDLPSALPSASPSGGQFSGPEVSAGIFDPVAAGLGTHTISYTFTDANFCTNTCTFDVTVNPLPLVECPSDFSVCLNDDPTTLTGGSPSGGEYSGIGVNSGVFDPATAGAGIHTITYTFTDANSCTNSCTFEITVNGLPNNAFRPAGVTVVNPFNGTLDFDDDHSICQGSIVNYGIQQPPAGTFTYEWTVSSGGTILIGANSRNVQVEWNTPGSQSISFIITNTVTGCTNSNSISVSVDALPDVLCPEGIVACSADDIIDLTTLPGTLPSGGTFTGPGVSGNDFSPSVAGVGTHTITYSFTDTATGCSNTCSFDIVVNATPGTPIADVQNDEGCEGDTAAERARVRVTLPGTPANFEAIWIIGNNPAGLTPGTEYGPGDNVTDILTFNTANRRTARIEPGAPVGVYEFCVRIRDRNTGCESEEACGYSITVNALPVANDSSLEECENAEGSGEASFDLTAIIPGITAEAGGVSVTWYSDEALTDEILDPSSYTSSTATVYALVTNVITGCSNVANVDLTVNALPVMECPADFSVCIDESPAALPSAMPEGGEFSGAGVSSGVFDPAAAGVGTHIITYTFTDSNSCTNTCTFEVTVNPLPIVECPSDFSVCFNDAPTVLTGGSPTGGVYSGPGVEAGVFSPADAGLGLHTITYTYTDANNCVSSCSFAITVNANPNNAFRPVGSPVLSGAAQIQYDSDHEICEGETAIYGAQQAPMSGTFTYSWSLSSGGIILLGANARSVQVEWTTPGIHSISFTITNTITGCTNTNSLSVTVNALPEVACPSDFSVCLDDDSFALEGATPTLGEYSGPGVSAGVFDPSVAGVGVHTIIYSFTDENGCSSTCAFSITVDGIPTVTTIFNSAPEGNCASGNSVCSGETTDVSFLLENADELIVVGIRHEQLSVSMDASICAPGGSAGYGPITGGTISVGDNIAGGIIQNFVNNTNEQIRVAFRVQPRSTTGAECVGDLQLVSILVDPAPSLSNCPEDILANTSDDGTGDCATDVTWNHPDVAPGCEPLVLTMSIDGGNALVVTPAGSITENFEVGTYTIVYTSTDGLGNSASCMFEITVEDDEDPTIECPTNTTRSTNPGECVYTVVGDEFDPEFGDNCPLVFITNDYTELSSLAGLSFPKGETTIVWTATDFADNSVSCTIIITIEDNEDPTIQCIADPTRDTDPGECDYTVVGEEFDPSFDDNCPMVTIVNDYNEGSSLAGAVFPKGETAVVWTATDMSGNSVSCTIIVTVEDNEDPLIQCFNGEVIFNGEGSIFVVVEDLVEASDNCDFELSINIPELFCEQLGEIIPITITATDESNNSASCISNVEVKGLPCGWSQNPDGINCTDGSSATFDVPTSTWNVNSINCYYANPFNSDELAYAQTELCGNGSITAQVTSITGTSLAWAGIVMRETIDEGSKKAQLMTNFSNFSRREFRTTTNGNSFPQQFLSNNRYWLRLTRTGNQFTMHVSPNGTTWFFIGVQNIDMPTCVITGLVVTNYNSISNVNATFNNVSVTSSGVRPSTGNIPTGTIASQSDLERVDLNIYPNPASSEALLDLSGYRGSNVTVEMTDLHGRVVRLVEVNGVGNLPINLNGLSSGMYLVKVRSEGYEDQIKRLIVNP